MSASQALRELESITREYAPGLAQRKSALVARLGRARLGSAAEVLRLHEVLCFLRAYPDDAELLAAVVAQLESFAARSDLKRHARALADSGIAGTSLHFPFHWVTARWLAEQWPGELTVDWSAFGPRERERLEHLLPMLVPYAESPDPELGLSAEDWLRKLKGPAETDATFLIRRFAALSADPQLRESLFHDLAPPLSLHAGDDTPSRTRAFMRWGPTQFQSNSLARPRLDLARSLGAPLAAVEVLPRREAKRAIELARASLIMRGRDLDGIMYASPDDVRLIDAGDGLTLSCLGLAPEYRALVETLYVFLLMKNGVPIGYYQAALLFESAEVNYHVFTTFRGALTREHYARALGVVRQLFGATSFAVHPYQLGHGNPDALAAGAFWFYQKLGFRPDNARVQRVLDGECARMAKDPDHRSPKSVLRVLSSDYLFLQLGRRRRDVAGKVALSRLSLAVSEHLAARFGSERERGLAVCAAELAELTGTKLRELSRPERLAWDRLAPLMLVVPGIQRWSAGELADLAGVVRAKGAVREQEFAARLDAHARLRRGLLAIARTASAV